MKRLFFIFFVSTSLLYADVKLDEQKDAELKKEKIEKLSNELSSIEDKITKKDSVWIKSYASYLASLDIKGSLEDINKRITHLQSKSKLSLEQSDELSLLVSREKILSSQIDKLKKQDNSPFSNLIEPPNIEDVPSITNPIDIFIGLSFEKSALGLYSDYIVKKKELGEIVAMLKSQVDILVQLRDLDSPVFDETYRTKTNQLERFESAYDTMKVTADVYEKQLDILKVNINKEIENQLYKMAKIAVFIIIIFLIYLLLKFIIKKYIKDNERFYMANKIITFLNVTLIVLVLFFSYIENVSYLVTILGFASAGIAIAMKDWFMSLLGWLVIVFGGSMHVGDRIRVVMDGYSYVGDIMDISLLRMTLLEDVTLTTLNETRRAGRIIFVPNNFIFTKMMANYTHSSLKSVWDGIDIFITFESNHKKAIHIVKEITKRYSKGYMEITRKQLNKLRSSYSLKNTNVEPRVFSFIEPNGLKISAWYLTNAYATLTLRSVISTEIIDAFLAEDDIIIAYPTQMIHTEKPLKRYPPFDAQESIV